MHPIDPASDNQSEAPQTWATILRTVSPPPLLAFLRLVAASSRAFPDSIVASVICNRLSEYADDASNPCPSSALAPAHSAWFGRGDGERNTRRGPG